MSKFVQGDRVVLLNPGFTNAVVEGDVGTVVNTSLTESGCEVLFDRVMHRDLLLWYWDDSLKLKAETIPEQLQEDTTPLEPLAALANKHRVTVSLSFSEGDDEWKHTSVMFVPYDDE